MPELPEVETTRRGLEPWLLGQRIQAFVVRNPRLRWPVPEDLSTRLPGHTIQHLQRRAKYLLVQTEGPGLLLHLGMSGSLRRCTLETPLRPHDHWRLFLPDDYEIRYHDPRRFGCCLPLPAVGETHPLLATLGPEPVDNPAFSGDYLYQRSRQRQTAIKGWIMDQRVVVGVGNIYATEALFLAGIHPQRPAGQVTLSEYQALAQAIQQVLQRAIARGGTTLRDFVREDGQHGYFRQELQVYGRAGQSCPQCGQTIASQRIGQRASAFCPQCQR